MSRRRRRSLVEGYKPVALRAHRRGGASAERLRPSEIIVIVALSVTPFAFHWLYGALVTEIALLLVAAQAALLCAIIAVPRLRKDLPASPAFWPVSVLFMAVIVLAAWSLMSSGGAATAAVWALVGEPPAGTLDRSATLVEIVKLGGLACVFVVAAAVGGSRRRLNLAVRLTVYCGAFFALVALLLSSADAIYATQGRRVEARFLNPNTAGAVFGTIAILALAMTWRRLKRGESPLKSTSLALDGASFAIAASALLMTLSRGALAATLLAATFLAAWEVSVSTTSRAPILREPAARIRKLIGMLACAVVMVALGWAFFDRVWPHLFTLQDDVRTRSLTAAIHLHAVGATPWIGYGLGSFETVNTLLFTPQTFASLWNIRAAQNVYIQWLEQAGWVGATCMFGCIAAVVVGTGRAVRGGGSAAWRSRALLAVNLVFLIHGMVDFSLETYSVAALWALLLGLNFGAVRSVASTAAKNPMPPIALAFALSSAAAAGFCLFSLDEPAMAELGRFPDSIAAGSDRASDLTVASGGSLAIARSLSWAALRLAPCDTGAWLRLAEIDADMNGEVGSAGVMALRNSYRVAPIDPYQSFWRVRFVLEHWAVLPPDVMDDADREIAGLAASAPHREGLATTLNDVKSDRGRLVASLWSRLYDLRPFSNSSRTELLGGKL